MIPRLLGDLPNPPKKLFHLGNFSEKIFENCVGIVGSRKMTDYGKRVIERIIPQLVFEKKTIVSGFMYGVDQYAHQICVDNGGRTIAVLGWGIDIPLYDYDKKLAKQIIDKDGLILSEWKDQKGTLWTFPMRNRIVAGLCQELIVVEASENSGSLITARIANKLKRKVWAVPGPITSKTSAGTNTLIASKQAEMWLPNVNKSINQPSNSPIISILENESLTADELARKLGRSVAEVGVDLSMLLLNGAVIERGSKYYLNDAN